MEQVVVKGLAAESSTVTASNDELLAFLRLSMAEEKRRIADIIGGLIEVEERQLHRALACTSMFHFCVHKLGMSESEAFRRLTAARLAKHFPPLLDAIRNGRIHLSTVVLLRDHFNESNVPGLISAVSGMSKREVEAFIARRSPKPDVPSSIRKLPEFQPSAPTGVGAELANSELLAPATPARGATETKLPEGAHVPSPSNEQDFLMLTPSSSKARPVGAQIEPLSAERHKVQFTASTGLRTKLERAQSLLRHVNPDGDLAVVIERALDLLMSKLERARIGGVASTRSADRSVAKRKNCSPESADKANVTEPPQTSTNEQKAEASSGADTTQKGKRLAVPRSTVREIMLRDGERCSFIGTDGSRCDAVDFLEVDHKYPHALGGGNEVTNLRLLCRSHNQYVAEQIFGRDFMARKRRKSKPCISARGAGTKPLKPAASA